MAKAKFDTLSEIDRLRKIIKERDTEISVLKLRNADLEDCVRDIISAIDASNSKDPVVNCQWTHEILLDHIRVLAGYVGI